MLSWLQSTYTSKETDTEHLYTDQGGGGRGASLDTEHFYKVRIQIQRLLKKVCRNTCTNKAKHS